MTKQDFFKLVDEKKEAEKKADKIADFFFDEAQWYFSNENLKALECEMKKAYQEIEIIKEAIEKAKENYTKEELRAMSREYHGIKPAAAV